MNLPSNVRSLVALGFFCTGAGAWLTFVTEARTRSLRAEMFAESTSIASVGSPRDLSSHATDEARSESEPEQSQPAR